MNTHSKILTVAYATLALAAGVRGEGDEAGGGSDGGNGTEPETPPVAERLQYLPASVYPAIYVVGGVARGLNCDESIAGLNARVAAADGTGTLANLGPTYPIIGVAFDYYGFPWMAAEIKILHTVGTPCEINYRYDASKWPPENPPEGATRFVDDFVSVSMQNVDAKLGLRLEPFADHVLSPYVTPGIGVNSTLIKTRDRCGDPLLQKYYDGPIVGNNFIQHYAFDWAVTAGVAVKLSGNLYLAAEGYYDRPFVRHFFAGHKYDTATTAVYAGAGWRFQ
jgi:opacity protein-like surface antigen